MYMLVNQRENLISDQGSLTVGPLIPHAPSTGRNSVQVKNEKFTDVIAPGLLKTFHLVISCCFVEAGNYVPKLKMLNIINPQFPYSLGTLLNSGSTVLWVRALSQGRMCS